MNCLTYSDRSLLNVTTIWPGQVKEIRTGQSSLLTQAAGLEGNTFANRV